MKKQYSKNRVKIAEQSDIDRMKGKLRKADVAECEALTGKPADEALQFSFDQSKICWVIIIDDEPSVAFGIASMSALCYKGIPWLLSTDRLKQVSRQFVKQSKDYIEAMIEDFRVLENWVDGRNKKSMRWLKWCGFTIDKKPYPIGLDNEIFYRFHKEKEGLTCV